MSVNVCLVYADKCRHTFYASNAHTSCFVQVFMFIGRGLTIVSSVWEGQILDSILEVDEINEVKLSYYYCISTGTARTHTKISR